MQIVLQEQELKEALTSFISSLGIDTANKAISVTFKAGRSGSDHTATIDIGSIVPSKVTPIAQAHVPEEKPEVTDAFAVEANETEPDDADSVFG